MSTCSQLHLQTLGSQPGMPKKPPRSLGNPYDILYVCEVVCTVQRHTLLRVVCMAGSTNTEHHTCHNCFLVFRRP